MGDDRANTSDIGEESEDLAFPVPEQPPMDDTAGGPTADPTDDGPAPDKEHVEVINAVERTTQGARGNVHSEPDDDAPEQDAPPPFPN